MPATTITVMLHCYSLLLWLLPLSYHQHQGMENLANLLSPHLTPTIYTGPVTAMFHSKEGRKNKMLSSSEKNHHIIINLYSTMHQDDGNWRVREGLYLKKENLDL